MVGPARGEARRVFLPRVCEERLGLCSDSLSSGVRHSERVSPGLRRMRRQAMRHRQSRRSIRVVWTAFLLAASAQPLAAQIAAPVDADLTQDAPAVAQPSEPAVFAPGDLGFRFHGYLRSGFGVDNTGKGQQPFIAPLAGSRYRLGNEAETYL